MAEGWINNEKAHKNQTGLKPDFSKTPVQKDGTRASSQFEIHTRQNITHVSPLSTKNFVRPVGNHEKVGAKWGN